MSGEPTAARLEWARHWPLVLGGTMGYSVINLHAFGIAAFVQPLETALGWSRAEVMSGLTVASAFGIFIYMAGGAAVDRFGARRVGLSGIVIVCSGIAALGTTSGGLLGWILNWLYISFGIAAVQGMVWTSIVATRFEASRGLAIAVVLNGSAITAAIVPLAATALIGALGWRLGFVSLGFAWFMVSFPLAFLLFRDDRPAADAKPAPDRPGAAPELAGMSVSQAMRSTVFWRITFCMFAFIVYTMTLSPNLIALLTEKGLSTGQAAKVAALMGVCGIIARLGVGYLLDRLPTLLVAGTVFLLPIIGCLLLLMPNPSYALLAISAACFGATVGAENDVLYYLVARYCGLRHYGALLGVIGSAGAIAGTIAPLASGWIHDLAGSYDPAIMILIGLMAASLLATVTMGRPDPRFTPRPDRGSEL